MSDLAALIDDHVRDIDDFPEPGVVFKDITPLLADPTALAAVVAALADLGRGGDGRPSVDKVMGIEARGFILAAPVALALGVGFVPARKPRKLPWRTYEVDYDLEYGSGRLQIHQDAVHPGERVLIVDDVLATGGTAAAAIDLVRQGGAEVSAVAMLLELEFLHGRGRLGTVPLHALRVL